MVLLPWCCEAVCWSPLLHQHKVGQPDSRNNLEATIRSQRRVLHRFSSILASKFCGSHNFLVLGLSSSIFVLEALHELRNNLYGQKQKDKPQNIVFKRSSLKWWAWTWAPRLTIDSREKKNSKILEALWLFLYVLPRRALVLGHSHPYFPSSLHFHSQGS